MATTATTLHAPGCRNDFAISKITAAKLHQKRTNGVALARIITHGCNVLTSDAAYRSVTQSGGQSKHNQSPRGSKVTPFRNHIPGDVMLKTSQVGHSNGEPISNLATGTWKSAC
eukprot:6204024-Amphidinium_carterae.2